jgi:hypothetical protein
MEEVTRFVITAAGSPRAVPPNGSAAGAFQRTAAPELAVAKPPAPEPAPAAKAAEVSAPKTFLRATYILAASAVLLILAALGNLAARFF